MAVDVRQRAEAVPFRLKEPIGIIERLANCRQRHGRELHLNSLSGRGTVTSTGSLHQALVAQAVDSMAVSERDCESGQISLCERSPGFRRRRLSRRSSRGAKADSRFHSSIEDHEILIGSFFLRAHRPFVVCVVA